MQMESVCVCGAGTMGRGIAQVAATAGLPVTIYDVNGAVLQQAEAILHGDLKKLVQKEKLTEASAHAVLKKISFTNAISQCIAPLIIEAVVEQLPVKTALLQQLAACNATDAIFASNTSSLAIAQLAEAVPNPTRVAGLHFFNPAPVMKLVEVVRGQQTAEAVIDALVLFTKAVGKTPVVCTDSPGFIVNRVARPYYLEALRLVEEGIISIKTADKLLEAAGFKLGPFKLMDLIGNDVNYAVSCSVYDQLGRPERLQPSRLQKEKVEQGALGKKTGRGYYDY